MEDGRTFRVIAIDYRDDTIEVQDEDGDLEEFDSDMWSEMNPAPAVSPLDSGVLFGASFDEADLESAPTLSDVLDQFEVRDYH
jgi:hypothetical protein